MARITLRQLLDHAAEHGYGVPAFNINNMEQVIAIMQAAREADAPVILQASRGARGYAGDIMIRKMVEAAEEMCPEIPVCLHQDHGNNEATCFSAIQAVDSRRRIAPTATDRTSGVTKVGPPWGKRG